MINSIIALFSTKNKKGNHEVNSFIPQKLYLPKESCLKTSSSPLEKIPPP